MSVKGAPRGNGTYGKHWSHEAVPIAGEAMLLQKQADAAPADVDNARSMALSMVTQTLLMRR